MKTISLKVCGSFKAAQGIVNFVATNRTGIAVAGAAAAYLGCLFSEDQLLFAGAAVALVAVRPSVRKGGRK